MADQSNTCDADRVACFSVRAAEHPGSMPRVLGVFAKESLTPTRWTSAVDDGRITMDIQMAGLAAARAEYLAEVIRSMPVVETVLTSAKSASPERARALGLG